jgi:hypothetical protein
MAETQTEKVRINFGQWPENTHVIAATSQNAEKGKSGFVEKIAENLEKGSPSIIGAYRSSENFSSELEGPKKVSDLSMWVKAQVNTPRQILVILGGAEENNPKSENFSRELQAAERIAKQFGVAGENVTVLNKAIESDVVDSLKKMGEFSKNHKNAEALIIFEGSGSSSYNTAMILGNYLKDTVLGNWKYEKAGQRFSQEGSQVGTFNLKPLATLKDPLRNFGSPSFQLHEQSTKHQFHKYLSGFKSTLLIVDTNNAGAWVGE